MGKELGGDGEDMRILKFLFGQPFYIHFFPHKMGCWNSLHSDTKVEILSRHKRSVLSEIRWAFRNRQGIFHYIPQQVMDVLYGRR